MKRTVKQAITEEMEKLSKFPQVVFLGENVTNSGRIYGTLDQVPLSKCIEMPLAENLIAGVAIGLSLRGYHPICIFQRMDFMLCAADAIVNHAALIPKMSGGRVKLPLMFRTIKANLNPDFFVGHQHSKDLTGIFSPYLQVFEVPAFPVNLAYNKAYFTNNPTLIVEDYKEFNTELE